jgi:zinc/manganese transport system permease protein
MGLSSIAAIPAMSVLADISYQSNWLDILGTNFMRNAFLGGTLVALASGLIGYFVIIRRDAFAAHALAHIGFPGATGAVLIGAPVTLGLAVFCVAGALAIGALGKRVDRREVATGTILAFATSLGVLFASLASRSANTVTSVLFGNLLAISTDQLVTYVIFTVLLVIALGAIARPLLFASINPEVAEAKGLPVRALGIAFLVMLALVVTMAVQVVGTLLLFALIVSPAATAIALTARPTAVVGIGTAIGLGAVWAGLVLSAMFNLPPSFPIVTIVFLGWLITIGFTRDTTGAAHPADVVHDHHHPAPPTKLSL